MYIPFNTPPQAAVRGVHATHEHAWKYSVFLWINIPYPPPGDEWQPAVAEHIDEDNLPQALVRHAG